MAIAIIFFSSSSFFFSFIFFIFIPLAAPLSFTYPTFDESAINGGPIAFQGDARVVDGAIHLTADAAASNGAVTSSSGRAVYATPVPVWDGATGNVTDFAARFSFVISSSFANAAADDDNGFAFFLSPYPSEPPASWNGTYLALFNGTRSGIRPNQIIAVEFDGFGSSAENDTVDTEINNFSVTTVSLNTSVGQGIKVDAFVNYNGSAKILSVSLSYAATASTIGKNNMTISHIVDLKEVLPSKVAVGFSSAAPAGLPHRILSWNFTSTLQAGAAAAAASGSKKNGRDVGLGVGIGVAVVASVASSLACWAWRRGRDPRRRRKMEEDAAAIDLSIDDAFDRGGGPRRFLYAQLAAATKNFSEERKLGKGGFGEVYRGELRNPKATVAIKKISSSSKQGKKEYVAEVTIISRLRHRNLVQLIGYCHEKGDLLLVYEFMPNGSLDVHLYGEDCVLRWPERHKIVLGLASALLYLHEECEQCVLHRDIKPSNLMLDSDFSPKLGDFGLAKLLDHDRGSLTTVWAGTKGYMAPEYCTPTGKACRESDIFSFGVVTLEIACGRKPIERRDNPEEVNLVQWVWDHYGRKTLLAAADGRLEMDFDERRMERMMAVGLWCAHPDYTQRPSIRQALNTLNFDAGLPDLPSRMPVPSFMQPPTSDYSSHSTNPSSSTENASSSNSCSLMSNSAMLGR